MCSRNQDFIRAAGLHLFSDTTRELITEGHWKFLSDGHRLFKQEPAAGLIARLRNWALVRASLKFIDGFCDIHGKQHQKSCHTYYCF